VSGPDAEAYVEAVLQVVEQIPAGRVASYGDVAEAVGRGGPRQVGQVMALHGGAVAWWRIVRADGSPARGLEQQALALLQAEGTPLRGPRVVISEARATLRAGGVLGGSRAP
jgi:alkylated DNA nucleotide flippase Atl1